MAQNLFIALAGNIGTGKTTAAELIANHFGFDLFREPVVDNRFLKPYYNDMSRWSFTLQMEFLLKRIEHQNHIQKTRRSCVQDRSLIEDPEIFAKYLHGLGHMVENELALYYDYFAKMHAEVRQPDKIVLLHTDDMNVLLRRIAFRGREEERGITSSFLKGLNSYYATFASVAQKKYNYEVLVVDVTALDIRQGEGRQRFLDMLDDFFQLEGGNELPFHQT